MWHAPMHAFTKIACHIEYESFCKQFCCQLVSISTLNSNHVVTCNIMGEVNNNNHIGELCIGQNFELFLND